jgi:Fe-S cluster assembly protein SufD
MMTETADTIDRYLDEFERADRIAAPTQPGWLVEARRHAIDRFRALGFPTSRDEEWRFTSVAPIAERAFELPAGAARLEEARISPFRFADLASAEIVFVNGRHAPELSNVSGLPAGVYVGNLASAVRSNPTLVERHLGLLADVEHAPFAALNTAFLLDAACVLIPPRTVVESPIHVLFVTCPKTGGSVNGVRAMSHPRLLVIVGESARVSVVESFAGASDGIYLTNAVTEIVLRDAAMLDHSRVQRESPHAFHMSATHVAAARATTFASHSISLGGSLVRNDAVAVMGGEGAECTLNGLYTGDGHRLVDNHTTIDHATPHCASREIYKGILADRARAVFNGKIIVRPDAQKTDAKQTNKALLLSEDAQINTKPQLEIFANDVRCTHGAAVGQIDEEAIFYLRSRGLSERDARNVLIHAFAADVITRMPIAALRATVEAELLRMLRARTLPSSS